MNRRDCVQWQTAPYHENHLLSGIHYIVATAVNLLAATLASLHVILHKRDPRAAIGWVGVVWLAPMVGSLLYFLFGINRVERKAIRLRSRQPEPCPPDCNPFVESNHGRPDDSIGHLRPLASLSHRVTENALLNGNSVTALQNGDEAFPEMLQSIEQAKKSITLCTYIYDNDRAGREFAESLHRAMLRGVEVRVLVDDVGSRYSWPSGLRLLKQHGIPMAKFLPAFPPWHFRYANLRNHRKLMIVDGQAGFTGGMNISEGNYLASAGRSPIRDLHFRIDGPVVHQMQEAFALDWGFSTGELLQGEPWYSAPDSCGDIQCRVITDGPDEKIDQLKEVVFGAISTAQQRITIVTPYFVPDVALIGILNTAAMKGVQVDIVLPAENNLRMVQWASTATFELLVDRGCQIWLSPPPFEHTKLMMVDGRWSMIGSANWDARSLVLNFELNVECYSRTLATRLQDIANARIATGSRVTMEMLNRRSMLVKVRDSTARLASPYL